MHAGETDAVIFEGSGCTGAVHKLVNAIRDFQVSTCQLLKKGNMFFCLYEKQTFCYLSYFIPNEQNSTLTRL